MSSITVTELHSFKKSTTSNGRKLIGYIHNLREDAKHYPKGSTFLLDPNTAVSILCHLDRFHVKGGAKPIVISKWNYIYDENLDLEYLEICLDNVYLNKSPLSVLKSGIIDDAAAIELAIINKLKFYTPSISLATVANEPIHVVGIIESVSMVYGLKRSEASFLVEISNETKTNTLAIYFPDKNSIKYRPCFRIGQYHTFQHLKPVILSHGRHHRGVLLFEKDSSTQIIPPSTYQKISRQHYLLTRTDNTRDLSICKKVDQKTTYTGHITRIIDSKLGIYELDHKIILCLYHHLVTISNQPFRVDTRLTISHFHKALIYTTRTSFLMDHVWKASRVNGAQPFIVLVGCVKTRIDIISFPEHCEMNIENESEVIRELKASLSNYILQHHFTFPKLVRILEIYAAIVTRFDIDTFTVEQLEHTIETISQLVLKMKETGFAHLGNDFFGHGTICSAIGSGQPSDDNGCIVMTLDSYPYIEACVDTLTSKLQPYKIDLAGSNLAFELDIVQVQVAEHDKEDGYILGIMDIDSAGNFFIKDAKSRMLLSTTPTTKLQVGNFYILRKCQLIKEDLSHVTETEKHDAFKTYIGCYENALLNIHSDTQEIKFRVRNPIDLTKLRFFNFAANWDLLSMEYQYIAVYVGSKSSILSSVNDQGLLILESKVEVKLYTIGSSHDSSFVSTDRLKHYTLVLSSQHHSLKFHNQLQLGEWCVIRGLNITKASIESKENDTIVMDDSHVIFPMITQKENIAHSVLIVPAIMHGASSKYVLPKPVMSVEQLTDINRVVGDTKNEIVDVRGVIVLKKFDHFSFSNKFESYAAPLFQDLNIGTGKGQRRLQIQLREFEKLQMINIYVDLNSVQYPLGLIHGATVTFRSLLRKNGHKNKSTYHLGIFSLVQIETTIAKPGFYALNNKDMKIDNLTWLQEEARNGANFNDKMFKFYCTTSTIISLSMKWECKLCGTAIVKGECFAHCKNASRNFSANAFIEITDSYTCMNASIDGERLLSKFLCLNRHQMNELKRLLLEGEAPLESIIDKARTTKVFLFYGKVLHKSRKQKHYLKEEESDQVEANKQGDAIKFKIFDIENVDHIQYADYLLNK